MAGTGLHGRILARNESGADMIKAMTVRGRIVPADINNRKQLGSSRIIKLESRKANSKKERDEQMFPCEIALRSQQGSCCGGSCPNSVVERWKSPFPSLRRA